MKDIFTEQKELIKSLKETSIQQLEMYNIYKKRFDEFLKTHPEISAKTDDELVANHSRFYKELCLHLSDQAALKNALFALSPTKIKSLKQMEELIANFATLNEDVFDKIFYTLKINMAMPELIVAKYQKALTNIPYYQDNIVAAEDALSLSKRSVPIHSELINDLRDRLANDSEGYKAAHEKRQLELAAEKAKNASSREATIKGSDKFEVAKSLIEQANKFIAEESKKIPAILVRNISKLAGTLQNTVNNNKTGLAKSMVIGQTVSLRSALENANNLIKLQEQKEKGKLAEATPQEGKDNPQQSTALGENAKPEQDTPVIGKDKPQQGSTS